MNQETSETPPFLSAVTMMTQAQSNQSLWESDPPPVAPGRILLGLGLASCTSITIIGNFLVIYAVVRQRYLRTITNYFIVSLACADLLMGIAVMPMAVYREVTGPKWPWPFHRNVCHLWHALDVLSSTASIINLCLIAVERYWATENPITYPSKMTKRRCMMMIAAGWICSSAISFPAIIWWRYVDPDPPVGECEFTTDSTYLLMSSVVSFYAPLVVMLFVYYRIYRTATNLIRSFNSGAKIIYSGVGSGGVRGGGADVMVLRIHRGRHPSPLQCRHPLVEDPDDRSNSATPLRRSFFHRSKKDSRQNAMGTTSDPTGEAGQCSSANRTITRKLRKFAMGRRLIKFNREQKAAKTLGIVMGIFIACWLPFFTCNIITVAQPTLVPAVLWAVVTWLGYINSSINPIIYAHSMRDFRRAFLKLLCACYLRRLRHQRSHGLRSNCNWNSNTYASPSSSCRRRLLGVSSPSAIQAAKRPPSPPSVQSTPLRTLQCREDAVHIPASEGVEFNGYLTPGYCPSKDSEEEGKEECLVEALVAV